LSVGGAALARQPSSRFSRRVVLADHGGTLLSVLFIGLLANGFHCSTFSSYWVTGRAGALILLGGGQHILLPAVLMVSR